MEPTLAPGHVLADIMDAIFLIPLLILLAVLIGSILGFVAFGRTTALRQEIAALRERLAVLEAGGIATAPAAQERAPDAAPAVEEAPAAPEEVAEPPTAAETRPATFREWGEAQQASRCAAAEPPVAEAPVASAPVWQPQQPKPKRDLEEAIGTRWAVWVGGVALALGGIFLVRYSIEAGLLGPAARIALGLLFAGLLLAAGEWLRRSGHAEPLDAATRKAYVPGVLTAAGIVAAFASVYAAHALYDFLSPPIAFAGLGLVAFAALALAILHGPAIAGLGLAASYATPLLVSSNEPAFGPLTLYLLLVAVATFALARLRHWLWLAVVAAGGSVVWSLLMILGSSWSGADAGITAIYVALSVALAAYVFGPSIHPNRPGLVAPTDRIATAVLSAFVLPVLFHIAWNGTGDAGVALLVAVAVAYVGLAYAMPALRFVALGAVVMVPLAYSGFDIVGTGAVLDPVTGGYLPPDLSTLMASDLSRRTLTAGVLFSLLFAGLGLFGVLGSAARTVLAVVGSAIPLLIAVVAYLRTADFSISFTYGLVALGLAAFFAVTTEALIRRLTPGEHGVDGAVAVYAVATIAALGLGAAALLDRGALTIALSLIVPPSPGSRAPVPSKACAPPPSPPPRWSRCALSGIPPWSVRTSAPRRSSTGCSTATACRRSPSASPPGASAARARTVTCRSSKPSP